MWSDWFLFSDAYVNGLRSSFLRPGSSGVTLFHSISGDSPDVKVNVKEERKGDVGNSFDQDSALAVGKGAAMKELLGLPLSELEKRCRHNGLSLYGGRERMVARLLYLEEAEKQRVFDRDEDLKLNQSYSTRNAKEDSYVSTRSNRRDSEGTQNVSESRVFASKKDPVDPILGSKWAEDDISDDDGRGKDSRDLGLEYSSSGSEMDGTDVALHVMTEEQRFAKIILFEGQDD